VQRQAIEERAVLNVKGGWGKGLPGGKRRGKEIGLKPDSNSGEKKGRNKRSEKKGAGFKKGRGGIIWRTP